MGTKKKTFTLFICLLLITIAIPMAITIKSNAINIQNLYRPRNNSSPVLGIPTPTNASTNNPLIFNWSIPITDPDGDFFNWTITCSNGKSIGNSTDVNGTKSLPISGLNYSTTYTVWVNATDPIGSGNYTRAWYTFTTQLANQPPYFGVATPANASINNSILLTWRILITDMEGDQFNWAIQCSNGQSNNSTGDINGSKSVDLSGLSYTTTYTVWVNATDPSGSNNYTRAWYTFTTKVSNQPPTFGIPTPFNGSTGNLLNLTWSIPISDPEDDTFYWSIKCSNGQSNNSSGATDGNKTLSLSGLNYSTTYTVWVNATDPEGSLVFTRSLFTFTTKPPNLPPIFGTPSPTNNSINNQLTLTWRIQINDPEDDLINWAIQCNNGQASNGTNEANGTKTLTINNLAYSTQYTVWVNATDPTGSNLSTQHWYKFTCRSADGGSSGGTTPPSPAENKKPIAQAFVDEPYQGLINTEIYFDGSGSYDPDGNITKWFWDFGDNTTGMGRTIEHMYRKVGTYTVTLTVIDNENATDTDTTTCVIKQQNRPPSNPIITGTKNGPKNTVFTYTVLSRDDDNDTIRYIFNWGDLLNHSSGFLPSGTIYTVNHSWMSAGRYDIMVTVSDKLATATSTMTVYIDAVQTGDIGYLLDNNSDGIYDIFYSDLAKKLIPIQKQDGAYTIDSDGDGTWDYTFDAISKGLITYQEPLGTPGFKTITFLFAIMVILLMFNRRRKKRYLD